MHFSDIPSQVRCDRFRLSGKWYDTFALDMEALWSFGLGPIDAVEAALRERGFSEAAMNEWIFVVLEPYHEHAYPVCLNPNNARILKCQIPMVVNLEGITT